MTHPIITELRRIRKESRMSQDAVAAALGKDSTQITNYERGHQSPRISLIADWADTLGYELVLQPKVTT